MFIENGDEWVNVERYPERVAITVGSGSPWPDSDGDCEALSIELSHEQARKLVEFLTSGATLTFMAGEAK